MSGEGDITLERANPKGLPQPLAGICLALVGLGIMAFVAGLVRDPQKTWLAFHSNFIFTTMLACAGLVSMLVEMQRSKSQPSFARASSSGV